MHAWKHCETRPLFIGQLTFISKWVKWKDFHVNSQWACLWDFEQYKMKRKKSRCIKYTCAHFISVHLIVWSKVNIHVNPSSVCYTKWKSTCYGILTENVMFFLIVHLARYSELPSCLTLFWTFNAAKQRVVVFFL